MVKNLIAFIICTIALCGCASIDFYSVNRDGSVTEQGFLYYPPKPYLLVESKDDDITTKVITLPDLTNPHRVKQDNGWGTADLGFEIENGMIKSFNSKTDSKGPETLTALASIGSAKAAIDTAEAAILTAKLAADQTKAMSIGPEGTKIPSLIYTVKAFEKSYEILKTKVLPPLKNNPTEFKDEIEMLERIQTELGGNYSIEYKPLKPDALLNSVENKRKLSKEIVIQLKNVASTLVIYAENKAEKPALVLSAKNANTSLSKVIKKLTEFSLRTSSVTGLYEISYINGKLNLQKVNFF